MGNSGIPSLEFFQRLINSSLIAALHYTMKTMQYLFAYWFVNQSPLVPSPLSFVHHLCYALFINWYPILFTSELETFAQYMLQFPSHDLSTCPIIISNLVTFFITRHSWHPLNLKMVIILPTDLLVLFLLSLDELC